MKWIIAYPTGIGFTLGGLFFLHIARNLQDINPLGLIGMGVGCIVLGISQLLAPSRSERAQQLHPWLSKAGMALAGVGMIVFIISAYLA
jgi:hypothetical protein